MTLTARYPGRCTACGGAFPAGTRIEWEGGRARHVRCPTTAASPRAPAARGTNQRPGVCDACGQRLAPGEGRLWRCLGSSSNCQRHWDGDAHGEGGWHVECQDRTACAARAVEARAAQEAEQAQAAAAAEAKRTAQEVDAAAYRELVTRLEAAGLERVSRPPAGRLEQVGEVARDDTRYYRGVLVEFRAADGSVVYRETASGGDDYRTYWWVTAEQARAARLAAAAMMGLTAERSRQWLAQYGGCEGADIHRAVVEAADRIV